MWGLRIDTNLQKILGIVSENNVATLCCVALIYAEADILLRACALSLYIRTAHRLLTADTLVGMNKTNIKMGY